MLNHALGQTGWNGPMLTDETWRDALSARLAEVSWPQALSDVEPFLESGADIRLLTPENLHSLLARAR